MLLQRSLVLAFGLCLYIAGFILSFKHVDAKLNDNFHQERQKFGVADGTVLTTQIADATPVANSAAAPAVAPATAPISATTTPNSTAASTDTAAPTTAPGSATTPSPALAPDANVIIGPVPPPAVSTPDSAPASAPLAPVPATPDSTSAAPTTPAPATPDSASAAPAAPATSLDTLPATSTAPAPAAPESTPATPVIPSPAATPDTNSAPMVPSSTMVLPKGMNHLALLALAGYQTPDGMRIQVPGLEQPTPAAPALGSPIVITPSTNGGVSPAPISVAPMTNSVTEPATNAAPFLSPTSTLAPTSTGDGARAMPVEASVIVLGYHQFVGPGVSSKNIYVMRQDVFESEMKYLKDNGYHVVPLSDVVRFIKHEIGLPPNSVAISIDDGYKSSIVWAAPVLKKYGYPWTFFVYPAFITVAEGKGAASWNDLLALQADGVDVECHSMTHPQLTKRGGKSPEEYDKWLTNETAGAKAILEQHLGKQITCFAYPYGAYNKEVEAKVIAAGFEAIFTVADNPVHSTTDIHSIGRYVITQPVEKSFTAYLRQGALSVANASPAPGATTSDPRPVITAVLGYVGNLDPKSIETDVRDFGHVKHDFDPKTSTVRLYLPRDLIQAENVVDIHVRDAQTGQLMVARWHFNYEPAGAAAAHAPIPATPATNVAPAPATATPTTQTEPATSASAAGTPMEAPKAPTQ